MNLYTVIDYRKFISSNLLVLYFNDYSKFMTLPTSFAPKR